MVKIDYKKAIFETDELLEESIFSQMRDNPKFLKMFYTDMTNKFYRYIDGKIKLREPISLGIKGFTRSGKSTIGITIACRIAEANGKRFSINNICENEFDFLKKVKTAEENDVFVIDEGKESVFGIGSMAKRMKIDDIQNIIAKLNISTIWITPRKFNDTNSDYGLRTLGRARNVSPRLVKLLLYNLSEGTRHILIPFGYVIIPVFMDIYEYGKELDKEYQALKDDWIRREKESETNFMFNIQKEKAQDLLSNPTFTQLKKFKDRVIFAKTLLPSEFTKQEIDEIVRMTDLIEQGYI